MSITNGYCTLAEFTNRVGGNDNQIAIKRTLIEREIERCSRKIDKITGDKFYPITLTASKARYGMGMNSEGLYISDDAKRLYFRGKDITITSITNDGVALVADTDYYIGNGYLEAEGTFTTDKSTGVVITGVCGYSSVPDEINECCLAMVEVTTGLGKYTVIDEAGNKSEITRDNIPKWVFDMLFQFKRFDNYG